jgi:hypothetical protein
MPYMKRIPKGNTLLASGYQWNIRQAGRWGKHVIHKIPDVVFTFICI